MVVVGVEMFKKYFFLRGGLFADVGKEVITAHFF